MSTPRDASVPERSSGPTDPPETDPDVSLADSTVIDTSCTDCVGK